MQKEVIAALRAKIPGVIVHPFGPPLLTHMAAQIEFPNHGQVNVNDINDLPHGAELRIDNKVTIVMIPLSFENNIYTRLLIIRACLLILLLGYTGTLAYIHITAHEVF